MSLPLKLKVSTRSSSAPQQTEVTGGRGNSRASADTQSKPLLRRLGKAGSGTSPRRFQFQLDAFAFPNELIWVYHAASPSGKLVISKRDPPPNYAHRCFVLVRAARQFLYHARFDPTLRQLDDAAYRRLIAKVLSRNPYRPSSDANPVVIPGYEGLRNFSADREALLKTACGGAWRSYVLPSHWRMIFPITRRHQEATASRLVQALNETDSPIIHLVRFPKLTINHGMILFDVLPTQEELRFHAYDPNSPDQPVILTYRNADRTFYLPPNAYWSGGQVDVIQIFRTWFF